MTPSTASAGRWRTRALRFRPRVLVFAGITLFLGAIARFYQPDTGFSSLLSIGDILNDSKVAALRQVPHHVYEGSAGYDGAYYVQLALHPALDNPELTKAIDNLPYRARRILLSWAAWVAGLGRPAGIVQAYALLNVVSWLWLAALLWRWLAPPSFPGVLRWAGVMFSHGLCMSVSHALVDGPALLLAALGVRALAQGRPLLGGAALALGGLAKETGLLAACGLTFSPRAPRTWLPAAGRAVLVASPLLLWMAYVRLRFGPAEDPGLGNFTWPLVGLVEKLGAIAGDLRGPEPAPFAWTTLAAVLGLVVQAAFFLLRWRPEDRWWRVGATFAGLLLFLSTPVWEGYPGAATRVLLPMTLAFNLLVPTGARWLPVLVAGNLGMIAAVQEFRPPVEFHTLRTDPALAGAVQVRPGPGWHGPETLDGHRWRWSAGRAEVRVRNESAGEIQLSFRAQAHPAEGERSLRVTLGERLLWGGPLAARGGTEVRFGIPVPPGESILVFSTDRPAQRMGTDPRPLAFRLSDVQLVAVP
ncbi:MAG: hypothetical protein ACO3G4_10720 [Opitutaceae bacterium]